MNSVPKVTAMKLGWKQPGSVMVSLDVELPDMPLPRKTAYVVLNPVTKELRMPTFVRSVDLEPGQVEKLTLAPKLIQSLEILAREFLLTIH